MPSVVLPEALVGCEVAQPYTRRTLSSRVGGEIMLARWAPRVRCAPHDHGRSRGIVLVIAGRFRERRFGFDGRSLNELTSVTRSAGSAILVSRTSIHDMECLDESGTTLHLYASLPAPMRLYDVDRRETVVVGEGHGAWLPAEHTLSRVRWVR